MRLTYYQQSPERVNPQFIGIANKYSQHKRKRLQFENRKKELVSDVFYTSKLDESLERTLESKLTELERLQQAHQRHQDELKYQKRELDERRKAELERLRDRNTTNRLTTKLHIEQARNTLRQRNKNNRNQLQLDLSRLSQRFEQLLESRMQEKTIKYNEIRQEKRMGRHRINSFYREKNRESLNSYISKIKKEKNLRKQHNRNIQNHENALKELSKTVEYKKTYLDEIQNQIFKYRTDLKTIDLTPARSRSRKTTEFNHSSTNFLPIEYSELERGKELSNLEV